MDRGQPVACGELDDELAVRVGRWVWGHNQAKILIAPHCCIAASIAAASRSGADTISTPNFGAESVAQAATRRLPGLSELNRMATRVTRGATSLSSSSSFGP